MIKSEKPDVPHYGECAMPPSTDTRIRKYRPSDLESCRILWAELTLWHRRIYGERTIGGTDSGRHFDAYVKKHGQGSVWVAEVDGRVVGMAGLMKNESYELEPLIVMPEHRRRGVGRKLAEAVVQAARKKGACYLSTRPVARNDSAIRFFHEIGFDVLGHIEMFVDFVPARPRKWKDKKRLAGRDFRY